METREIRGKVSAYMQSQDISPNARVLEIKCNQNVLTSDEIKLMCEVFGSVNKLENNDKGYIVTFHHATDALVAKETINKITSEEIGCEISADWIIEEEIIKVFEIIHTPDVFVPIPRKTSSIAKSDPPECLKYIARFPITMHDAEGFHLREKVLGAKGCNFRKIVEICAKDFVVPERPKDLVKIRILKGDEFEVKLSSRYVGKFQTACGLLYELITVIFEEYKRYCEIQGVNPSDLRVRKLEQIKGRRRVFRERKENPLVYCVPGLQ